MKSQFKTDLATPFEREHTCDWSMYPRPQLKRESYFSLCGKWELSVLKDCVETYLGEITVPFVPESRLSCIQRALGKGEKYVYKKSFTLDECFLKKHTLIHFGAVDSSVKVYLNNTFCAEHEGGFLPFDADVTDIIRAGENTLIVEVSDDLSPDYPYGKQRRRRGGMWYTAVSGIWQTVWLESLPENYIRKIKITPALTEVKIETLGGGTEKTLTLENSKTYSYSGDTFVLSVDTPKLWTPDNPYLYHFTLTDGCDVIESYFALRTVDVVERADGAYIALNGNPYYFHGLLSQGYFSDGIYTPATPDGYIFDILEMKKQGFNMLRVHAKLEPDLFYYFCDKYGMTVFQDIVNSGKYSFIRDTALPTVGVKKLRKSCTPKRRQIFEKSALDTLNFLYNHPSVLYYTIFNEGWGQFDADGMYTLLKTEDPSRLYDSTSGWFFENKSDVESHHVYFKPVRFKKKYQRPLVLSEFGGYSCKIDGHCFNLAKNYGYKIIPSKEELQTALEKLYINEVLPAVDMGLCATVLTQVSDIEDETNGLVTYDRCVIKTDSVKMRKIYDTISKRFNDRQNKNSET